MARLKVSRDSVLKRGVAPEHGADAEKKRLGLCRVDLVRWSPRSDNFVAVFAVVL